MCQEGTVKEVATNDRSSALPDAGDFLKMVSVQPAAMSGS